MNDESNHEETVLNVYGRGVSSAKPDYFSMHFEVSFRDPDDDYCYETVAKKAEKLLKALKTWKKENDLIRTTSFSFSHYTLDQKYGGWVKGTVLATVSTTIYVESGRIEDIASLISCAHKAGASEISDITFSLSDSLRKAEREKALRLAAEAARHDATVTAAAFGMQVIGISRVDIMNGSIHDNYSDRYCCNSIDTFSFSKNSLARYDDGEPEFIEAGEIKTAVAIDAVFRLST